MINLPISEANKADYNELIELWQASVKSTHHFLTDADIAHYKPLIYDYYFDSLRLYCIRYNGKIAGFIGIKDQFIQMLFVLPQQIGKGIGKRLINFVLEKYDAKTVDVNEQNEGAMKFYQKMGFQTISRSEVDATGKPFPIITMQIE